MIINVNGPNNMIAVSGSALIIGDFVFCGRECPGQTIDLAPYQGQTVRVYLNDDGAVSVYPNTTHYWLLAEVDVPSPRFSYIDTGEADELGMAIMQQVPVPLDLAEADIRVWALPEVK